MVKFPCFIILIALLTNLWGCSYFSQQNNTYNIEPINLYEQQGKCKEASSCSSYKLTSLSFKKEAQLNKLIENRLLTLMNASNDLSLKDYLTNFLAKANQGDHLNVHVKLLEENSVFIVLKLSIHETHTTNQYSPKKIAFINYDKNEQKDISLAEAIQPDKIQAFWSIAQIAHTQWLEANQLLNNKMFQEDWPFIETPHAALLSKYLILKYKANELAPYAMGEPMLIISYDQLTNIIKPAYLPR